MVVEVHKDNLILLFELLEPSIIDIAHFSAKINCTFGVMEKVPNSPKTGVLDSFAATEEQYRRIATDTDIFAKPCFNFTIDLAHVQLTLHLFSKLIPDRL